MCGRFARHSSLIEFSKAVGNRGYVNAEELSPSFNVAPSQKSLVLCYSEKGCVATAMVWGLQPYWLRNTRAYAPINARSETAHEKAMFRHSFHRKRCLIFCDGYFEWQKTPAGAKQAHYIHAFNKEPFVLAGLWDKNEQLTGKQTKSFVILTALSNQSVSHIHERMPVRLNTDEHMSWLDPNINDTKSLRQLLDASDSPWESYPVGSYVNNPRNNSNRCINPERANN
jgi:putative SOS response-associated peptidase YedK